MKKIVDTPGVYFNQKVERWKNDYQPLEDRYI